jgi:hypothetical protein
MERDTAHLELAIDLDSDPISGSVSNGTHGLRSFTGWIELVAVIEAARSSAALLGGERQTLGSLPGANASVL